MRDPINAFTHLHIYALTSRKRQPTKEYVRNYEQKMQNKPNFPAATMSATSLLTKDYENKSDPTLGENKPNSNPIQTQTNPIAERPKMNASSVLTKYYQNISACRVAKNKPNSNPNKPNFAEARNNRNHLFYSELRESGPPKHVFYYAFKWRLRGYRAKEPADYPSDLGSQCGIMRWRAFADTGGR